MERKSDIANGIIIPLITTIIVVMDQFFMVKLPGIITIAIVASLFVFIPKKYYLSSMSFMILFDTWISLYIIFPLVVFLYVFRFNFSIKSRLNINCLIPLVLFEVLCLFVVLYEDLNVIVFLKGFIYSLSFIYIFSIEVSEEEVKSITKWFIYSFIITIIITLAIVLKTISITQLIKSYRLGYTTLMYILPSYSIIPNENRISRYAVLFFNVCFIAAENKIISKKSYTVFQIFSILVILLTQSRTGLFLLLLSYLFMIYAYRNDFLKQIKLISFIALGTLFAYIIVLKYYPNLINTIMKRFDTNDMSNGRNDIFNIVHGIWQSESRWILFGFGDQLCWERFSIVPHNAYQAYVVYYGIVGATFFAFFLLFYMFNTATSLKNRMGRKVPLQYWIPILMWLIGEVGGAPNLLQTFFIISFLNLFVIEEMAKNRKTEVM